MNKNTRGVNMRGNKEGKGGSMGSGSGKCNGSSMKGGGGSGKMRGGSTKGSK